MASINGVTVKDLERFYGPRGEYLYRGTVYHNGKRLGSWTQKLDGSDDFDFDRKEVEEEVDRCIEYFISEKGEKDVIFNIHCFMQELVCMAESEKAYAETKRENPGSVVCIVGNMYIETYVIPRSEAVGEMREKFEDAWFMSCLQQYDNGAPYWAGEDPTLVMYYPDMFNLT